MRRLQLLSWTAGIALALGAASPSFAQGWRNEHTRRVDDRGDSRGDYRGDYRDRDRDRGRVHQDWNRDRDYAGEGARRYHPYTREGARRGEIRRIDVDARDLRPYQRDFEYEPGWRTQGVTYGLVGPLTRYPELTFLDDAVLVGSYEGRGERVYVYLFDLRGDEHEVQVASDGAILDDVVLR